MVKLITLIKAYKLALSNISNKIPDWNRVYLGSVKFSPTDKPDTISFIFSNSNMMEPGAMGLSAALPIESVELFTGGLDSIAVAEEYANNCSEINDIGKMLLVFDKLCKHLQSLASDISEVLISEMYFNYEKNLVVIQTSILKEPIYTDGNLFLIGM